MCLGDQTVLAKHKIPKLCSGQHPASVLVGQAVLPHQHAPPQGGLHPHPEVPLPIGPYTPFKKTSPIKICLVQVTECEIFLSLIVKFLDPDKPCWQRSLALEVLHKLCVQPVLLESFCECYDLKAHATKIFRDIVNSLGAFVQSLFIHPQLAPSPKTAHEQPPAMLAGMPVGPGVTPQPGFYLRGVWLPLAATFMPGQAKST